MNKNNEDLISVIILVYNSEKYLRKCINSIINQTYKNKEIIIINDGSTDKSEEIIKEYILNNNNNNIKFINRSENKGTMYSRCEGYNNANGKYIMFVDSDDWIDDIMLEKMYSYMLEYNVDLVKCNYKLHRDRNISYNKEIINAPTIYQKEKFEPYLYDILYDTAYCNCVWMQLIKRDKLIGIEEINKNLKYGEDLQINLLILKNINSLLFVPDYLYNYYINEESITNKIEFGTIIKKIMDSVDTYNVLYNYVNIFKINNKDKYRKMAIVKLSFYLTMISLQLFANLKCNVDIKNSILELRNKNINKNDEKMIFNKLKSKNIIFALGFKLFMKNNLIYFEIYSKTIYKFISKMYKIINKS